MITDPKEIKKYFNIEDQKLYRVEEAAQIIGKSDRQIRRYLKAGYLNFIRTPGISAYFIPGTELIGFLQGKKSP